MQLLSILPSLKHQAVRDLAWSCFSNNLIDDFSPLTSAAIYQPGYISSTQIALTASRKQWLQGLDKDPSHLINHLKQLKSPRLGIYFEALWQYFFEQDEQYELIAHNLPVYKRLQNQSKKTLGEFDIIYRDLDRECFVHLELAIKYYLNYSTTAASTNEQYSNELDQWLGPNANDNFDKKVSRLLNHQIRLSETVEAKQQLKAMNINSLRKEIAIKGMLFYPYNNDQLPGASDNLPINSSFSPNHHYSYWLTQQQFNDATNQSSYWLKLDKTLWLSPTYGKLEKLENKLIKRDCIHSFLHDHFSVCSQPLMLCAVKIEDDEYHEMLRFFITDENWPL